MASWELPNFRNGDIMLDNATQAVLDVIDKSELQNNSLVNTVGTPNYFASVIDAGHYIAHCTDGCW